MRKRIIQIAVVIALFAGLGFMTQDNLRAFPVSATISSVEGDVQVKMPDSDWQKAEPGITLPSGTMVKTGAQSSAVIKWSTANVMKLTPFTNFTIKDIDVDPRTKTVVSNMDLFSGKVKAQAEKLKNPSSEFSISTPTAVAGVRGTNFDLENTPDNTTNLTTHSGSTTLTAAGKTVHCGANQQVSATPGAPPSQPQTLSDDEKNKCDSNEDCWSGVCVENKCQNEQQSISQGGCKALQAACSSDNDCCDGSVCGEEGVCVEEEASADACLPDTSKCEAAAECCSKVCTDGACVKDDDQADACFDDGEQCEADEECCSDDCVDGACAAKDAARAAACFDENEECTSDDECCSEFCDNGFCAEEGSAIDNYVEVTDVSVNVNSDGTGEIVISGTTIPEVSCEINGSTVTSGSDGSFTAEIPIDLSSDVMTISATCTGPDGGSASADFEIDLTGEDSCGEMFVELMEPMDGELFPLSDQVVSLSGSTVPGASCDINGTPITAEADGSFSAELSLDFEGEVSLNISCMDLECDAMAEYSASIEVKGPPQLIIESPPDGYLSCPFVRIAGQVDPDATVDMNGIDLFSDGGAFIFGDGAFEIDSFHLVDCTQTLTFTARDQFDQITTVTLDSGATADPTRLGINITDSDLVLSPTGHWINGMTEIEARLTLKSTTPFSFGLAVTFTDGNDNFLGNATLEPIAGLSVSRDTGRILDRSAAQTLSETFYAQAVLNIMYDPTLYSQDFTVKASMGGGSIPTSADSQSTVIIRKPVCSVTTMVPGDQKDNDCDGFIDEDPIDGKDNDGDRQIDEDSPIAGQFCNNNLDDDGDDQIDEEAEDGYDNDGDNMIDEDTYCGCELSDQFADCDRDMILNGQDCNPQDAAVVISKDDPNCAARCDAYESPDGDCDQDGLINSSELARGTDPYSRDSDGDTFSDLHEINESTNPLDPMSYPGQIVYEDITATAGVCYGGQIATVDGQCVCPPGTTWDFTLEYCKMSVSNNCDAGKYFDYAVGGCVVTCTGGQLPDDSFGECYCPAGTFLDPNAGYCVAECPAGMIMDPAMGCACAEGTFYDMLVNSCVTTCSGGQTKDPVLGECVCPAGTFIDPFSATPVCQTTTSTTLCPSGTAGAGCDTSKYSFDCDGDGMLNGDEMIDPNRDPCINEVGTSATGELFCPDGTDAPLTCNLNDMAGDCDGDTVLNSADLCPCRIGTVDGNGCSCKASFSTCASDSDCCNASDVCLFNPDYGKKVCQPFTDATTLCNNDGTCQYWDGEDGAMCPADCTCNYDGVCDYPAEDEIWCGDCGGYCGDGMCEFDFGTEDSYTCPQDCGCDRDGVCEPELNEVYGWCPDDCTCTPDGQFAFGPADCCNYFDFCTETCTRTLPVDSDGDVVPDTCDMCPNEPGPEFNDGCPTGCMDNAECSANSPATPYCDFCDYMCVATPSIDSDADMIPDTCDQCPYEPGTPDMEGCPQGGTMTCTDMSMCNYSQFCDHNTGTCNACDPMMDNDGVCCNGESYQSADCGWMGCTANWDCTPGQYCEVTSAQCITCDTTNGNDGICCSGEDTASTDCMALSGCSYNSDCSPMGAFCDMATYMCMPCDYSMQSDGICCNGENTAASADCAGVVSCSTIVDAANCDGNPDCWWDGSTTMCYQWDYYCDTIYDQAACDYKANCYWDGMSMMCKNNANAGTACTVDSDCAASNEFCDMSMTCSYCDNMMTTDGICCNGEDFAGTDCSGGFNCNTYYTDSATCNSDTMCWWDNLCVNWDSSCTIISNATSCADKGCSWDGTTCTGTPAGANCANYADGASCDADNGCWWDGSTTMCYGWDYNCYSITDSAACANKTTNGCAWDGTLCTNAGYCDSTYADQTTCNSDSSCFWDTGMLSCTSWDGVCSSLAESMACSSKTIAGCSWDGTSCMMSGGSTCASFYPTSSDASACDGDTGCWWDGSTVSCIDWDMTCMSITDSVACGNKTTDGCSWDGTSCISGGSYCPTSYPSASYSSICDYDAACWWDNTMVSCIDWDYSCTSITDSTACSNKTSSDSCLWDGTSCIVGGYCPTSYPSSSDAVFCDSDSSCWWDTSMLACNDWDMVCTSIMDSAACANKSSDGCTWDGTSCISGGYCPTTYPTSSDATFCDVDTLCWWDTSMLNCNDWDSSCTSIMDSAACANKSAYGCTWDGTACVDSGYCDTTYADQTSCEADSSCYWDSTMVSCTAWNMSCPSITDSVGCAGKTLTDGCIWDGTSCVYSYCAVTGTNQTICDAEYSCWWEVSMMECKDWDFTCGSIANQTACESKTVSDNCAWDGASCYTSTCAPFTDSSTCNANADCWWDTAMTSCNDWDYSCTTIMDMASCEAKNVSDYCAWDGASCNISVCSSTYPSDSAGCNSDGSCWWDSTLVSCEDWDMSCASITDATTCTTKGCTWSTSCM